MASKTCNQLKGKTYTHYLLVESVHTPTLHSAPFFAVRKQFWKNLLKRGENEFYTDNCRHSNQLFLEDLSVNHNFLQTGRPISAPLG